MLFFEFPISEPLRFPLLVLEWIIAVISFEIGLTFLMKYNKQPKQIRTPQGLGFASFFIGFSLMWFSFIIADYYASDFMLSPFLIWNIGSERNLFLNIGYFSLMTGALLFIFVMEKYKKYLLKKYVFTTCFLFIEISFVIIFFFNLEVTRVFYVIYTFLFLFFYLIYFLDFFKRIIKKENPLTELLNVIFQLLLLTNGLLLSNKFIYLFGLDLRLVGAIFQLISLGLAFNLFVQLPPFFEIDWQDKIEELLVLDKAGVCLFYKSFTDKELKRVEALISGAITSVNIMLEELTPAKGVKTSIIEKKGKIVNIFSSELTTGVIISNEKLNSINFYLKEFIEKVEKIYRNVLLDWDGDIDVFSPLEDVVKEFFL